jgi:hypothetical protein
VTASGWPVLDPVTLQGFAGDVVRALGPHTEADPAALLVDFLVSFGNAVGPGPHAVADGAPHPARLNAVVVGDTSRARKGTSRAQIGRLFAIADPGWHEHRVMGGLASGEGLIAAVRDGSDDEAAVTDKRLLVVEPEFARVLRVAAREGNTLSALIRECWDSGDLRVLTRKDPLAASGAHVSIIGHITREELLARLTDTDAANGFGNRFLFVCARRSKLLPNGGSLPEETRHELGRELGRRLDDARRIRCVRRDGPSEALWVPMYHALAEDSPTGLAGSLTARAEAQCLRLSVCYALIDGSATMREQHLEAAWETWRYAEGSVRHLFSRSGDPIESRLLAALDAAGGDGLDGREQHELFAGHASKVELDRARAELEARGLIKVRREPTAGRPRTVWIACEQSERSE